MTTSSVELHVPLVIVQRNVMSVFVGTLVTVELCDELLVIEAPPEDPTKLQAPVPDEGLLPFNVNVEVLHNAWSVPAVAVVT